MKRMYIRHTVGGRLFFDSQQDNADFELREEHGVWIFAIPMKDGPKVTDILQNRHELNLFLIPDDHDPERKSWFYTSQGDVSYDEERHELIIAADVRKNYLTS